MAKLSPSTSVTGCPQRKSPRTTELFSQTSPPKSTEELWPVKGYGFLDGIHTDFSEQNEFMT